MIRRTDGDASFYEDAASVEPHELNTFLAGTRPEDLAVQDADAAYKTPAPVYAEEPVAQGDPGYLTNPQVPGGPAYDPTAAPAPTDEEAGAPTGAETEPAAEPAEDEAVGEPTTSGDVTGETVAPETTTTVDEHPGDSAAPADSWLSEQHTPDLTAHDPGATES